jgi:hypothetical protein
MRKFVLVVALSVATLAGSVLAAEQRPRPEERPRVDRRGEVRSQEHRPMIHRRRHYRRARRAIIRRHRGQDSRPHRP